MWKKYKNKHKESPIRKYIVSDDYFAIKYKESEQMYMFKEDILGENHLQNLIDFAKQGKGLQRYIDQHHLEYQVINEDMS